MTLAFTRFLRGSCETPLLALCVSFTLAGGCKPGPGSAGSAASPRAEAEADAHARVLLIADVQAPDEAATNPSPAFPIPISYEIAAAGKVAIAIDDAQGHRVRNLLAEAPRDAGRQTDTWDGRDDRGNVVAPGAYRFKGVVTPQLSLTYEFTVNNSGDPPWWKQDVWEPRPTPGGWMSDHAPPLSAAAAGDRVFLGSETAEHGHSIIALDLDGKKLWGAKWLDLAGAHCLASDGKTIYSAGEGAWIGERMRLFAISVDTFAVRKVAEMDFSQGPLAHQGGLSGLAARDGLVYASFNPPKQPLDASALDPAALDIDASVIGGLQPKHVNALMRVVESDQPWVNIAIDPAKTPYLRIAWKTPQTIGTIVSPQRLAVWALKPTAAYPGDLHDDSQWEPFASDDDAPAMKLSALPTPISTRALRLRVLSRVSAIKLDQPQKPIVDEAGEPPALLGFRAIGSSLRRVTDKPEIVVSSGEVLAGGAWENHQPRDITFDAPASYTLRFPSPVPVRGLVIRDPFFAGATVELQTAPNASWTPAGRITCDFPWRHAYNDKLVDLGDERTLVGLRLLVTDPAVDQNADVKKRTGLTRQVCSLGGIVLLQSSPAPGAGERITVLSASDGHMVRDLPIASPGALVFDKVGNLLAVSGRRVVSVPLDGAAVEPRIVANLQKPAGITCDAAGDILVSDCGDDVVKRFTHDGKFVSAIGKPGGLATGPYDPQHMSQPHGICVDARRRLWVAEAEMRPKKVSVWNVKQTPATLERFFIGGPRYGSGFMYIDPRTPSRFFYEGMEFAVDWKAGTSSVKNILWREAAGDTWPGVTCDRPVYIKDKLYLLGEPFWFYGNRYVAIAKYAIDHAVPVAAAGLADEWPPLQSAALQHALGNPKLNETSFLWSDLNDDGKVQANEVKISPKGLRLEMPYFGGRIGDDLTIQFPTARLAPLSFTAGGAPIYDFQHLVALPKLTPGGFGFYNTAMTGDGAMIEVSDQIAVHDPSGALRWAYADHYNGVHGSMKAPPPQPGMLIGTLHVIGKLQLPQLGEVFAVSTNKGEVELFTTDGLWIARLFQDNRFGRSFNLPEARRGMPLDDISLNAEHFGGTLNQLADGRIYLVAGHNHNSVIRLDGLEKAQRFDGKLTFNADQAAAAQHPTTAPTSAPARPDSGPLVVARSSGGIAIDGDLADWAGIKPIALKGTASHAAEVRLAYDPGALLLAFDVHGATGAASHEKDLKMLFRAGNCVDLHLRTSDARGADVAAGDVRIVLGSLDGQPTAVAYRPVVPGALAAGRSTFASPVGSVTMDVVERLDVAVAIAKSADGYTVEAAIPWKALGIAPHPGLDLTGDVGVLFADKSGLETVERLYHFNHETGLVSDVPGEARLQPSHWGVVHLN